MGVTFCDPQRTLRRQRTVGLIPAFAYRLVDPRQKACRDNQLRLGETLDRLSHYRRYPPEEGVRDRLGLPGRTQTHPPPVLGIAHPLDVTRALESVDHPSR